MNVNIENFVGVFENAFSKEYCDEVIEYFEQATAAGFVQNRQQQNADTSKRSINDSQFYAHSEFSIKYTAELATKFSSIFWNELYSEYVKKFDIMQDFASHKIYSYKVQKTEVGQGYHVWHTENMNKDTSERILTWILYLNDVEEGGETEFLYYPKRIKPKTGTLILWPAGFTHTHRGNPPISNTKYIVTGWVEF